VRAIKKEDLCKHSNPDFQIEIVKDDEVPFRRIHDIFSRIKQSDDEDRQLVLILPQPHPQYAKVAYLINQFRVNCRNLFTFNMDEWADEDGNIAPDTWPLGFMYSMKHNFMARLDPDLAPPENQIQGPTNKNWRDYGKMIEDLGGADVCYGGIGWSGHVAFIEPGSPEFSTDDLEEFKQMGPRLVTLSPFSIAQSSLDPDLGMSGDWSNVPPKGFTIGPKEILGAKLRSSWNPFTIASTSVSWQRFSVRFGAHGPITPKVPSTILQIGPTQMYISETIAQNIESHTEFTWYG
jgi:6-phosphogluconolactonase/glucosamine-6-phosphate isomerase/deaminase